MKKIPLLLGLFCAATVFAQTATPVAASAATPSDEASLAYFRAAQMGTIAVDGAPGNGRYFPPVPADPKLPTLWVIGDSTVRNGTLGDGVGNMNQWGWGAPLTYYFDFRKINIVNRAFGGTTSHSFYDGFFWKNMQPQIKKGDFVILQFGANDGSTPKGAGDEMQGNLHTFGWYLKQFVKETRAQGATCIICSLTPRKNWVDDAHFRRDNTTHVAWAAQAAKEINAPYIDLYELIARKYEELGPAKVDPLFEPVATEHLHTGWSGAVVNAERVVSGIKSLKDCPLATFLSKRGQAIAAAPAECVADNTAPAK